MNALETLERRRHLTTATVSGTPGPDTFRMTVIGNSILIEVNGTPQAFADSTTDDVRLLPGAGNDVVYIDSTGNNPVTIDPAAGADQVHLADTARNLNDVAARVTVNASTSGGSHQVWLRDDNRGIGDGFVFISGGQVSRNGFGILAAGTASVINAYAGAGADTFRVDAAAAATTLNLFGQDDGDYFDIDESASRVNVFGNAGDDELIVNANASGQALVRMAQSDRLDRLEIGFGGSVVLDDGVFIHLATNTSIIDGSLTIGSGGVIESNSRVFAGRDYYTVRVRPGGNVTNPNVTATSANALGLGYGSDLNITQLAGYPVTADDLVIRYTLRGDATLDGIVDLRDFNRLASRFGRTEAYWSDADFNYDGTVNLQDFNRLAGRFGQSVAPAGIAESDMFGSAVPEPSGLDDFVVRRTDEGHLAEIELRASWSARVRTSAN
jgi:hypothetical protein